MLKGKQTNRSVCGKHITDSPPSKCFIVTTTRAICAKIIKRPPLMLDTQFMTLFGNVYYAACDRAHRKWLQAAAMPGESGKRSQAKQLAWLEGGHAVTRKHVLKMHKASGTSRVFETHRLSLHKRNGKKTRGAFPPPRCTPAGLLRMHKKTPLMYVWCRTCLMWL